MSSKPKTIRVTMANNHYLAANFNSDLTRDILGHIYAPSRKKAQNWLDQNYGRARALLYAACSAVEQKTDYPILYGTPTCNDRGAGRKSTGLRRSATICGLTKKEADHYDQQPNRGAYIASLIKSDVKNQEQLCK